MFKIYGEIEFNKVNLPAVKYYVDSGKALKWGRLIYILYNFTNDKLSKKDLEDVAGETLIFHTNDGFKHFLAVNTMANVVFCKTVHCLQLEKEDITNKEAILISKNVSYKNLHKYVKNEKLYSDFLERFKIKTELLFYCKSNSFYFDNPNCKVIVNTPNYTQFNCKLPYFFRLEKTESNRKYSKWKCKINNKNFYIKVPNKFGITIK